VPTGDLDRLCERYLLRHAPAVEYGEGLVKLVLKMRKANTWKGWWRLVGDLHVKDLQPLETLCRRAAGFHVLVGKALEALKARKLNDN
jgi:hypothetical protein